MTEQQLFTLLKDDAGISAIVGTRVYNGWLPEGRSLPAVTFEYISDQPQNTLAGDSGRAISRYTINVWSRSYATAQSLLSAVRTAMAAYPRQGLVALHEEQAGIYRFALDYSIFQ